MEFLQDGGVNRRRIHTTSTSNVSDALFGIPGSLRHYKKGPEPIVRFVGSSNTIGIVVVHPNGSLAKAIKKTLKKCGAGEVTVAESLSKAQRKLEEGPTILFTYVGPDDLKTLESIKKIQGTRPDIAIHPLVTNLNFLKSLGQDDVMKELISNSIILNIGLTVESFKKAVKTNFAKTFADMVQKDKKEMAQKYRAITLR